MAMHPPEAETCLRNAGCLAMSAQTYVNLFDAGELDVFEAIGLAMCQLAIENKLLVHLLKHGVEVRPLEETEQSAGSALG